MANGNALSRRNLGRPVCLDSFYVHSSLLARMFLSSTIDQSKLIDFRNERDYWVF